MRTGRAGAANPRQKGMFMKEYSIHYVENGEEYQYGRYSTREFAEAVMRTMQTSCKDVYLLEREVSEWKRVSGGGDIIYDDLEVAQDDDT